MSSTSSNSKKQRKSSHANTEETCNYSWPDHFDPIQAIRKGSADIANQQVKYKTEICQFWAVGSNCPFGDKCTYAHGRPEMRSKDYISKNYKTKNCRNFTEFYHCCYGLRCQFLHDGNISCKSISKTSILQWFGGEKEMLNLLHRKEVNNLQLFEDNIQNPQWLLNNIENNCENNSENNSENKMENNSENNSENNIENNSENNIENNSENNIENNTENNCEKPVGFMKPRLNSI